MPRRSEHPPPSRPLGPDEADRLAELMSAFSASSRVKLLFALVGTECSVEELAAATSLSPGVVSQQLRVLRLYRLVEGRRDGRHVRYRLQGHHVEELLGAVRAHADHVVDDASLQQSAHRVESIG